MEATAKTINSFVYEVCVCGYNREIVKTRYDFFVVIIEAVLSLLLLS